MAIRRGRPGGGFNNRQVAARLILFGQRGPGAVVFAAFNTGFDERDTGPAVLDVGVFAAVAVEFLAGLPFAHVGLEAAVQPGEGVVKRFGMTSGNRRLRPRSEARLPATQAGSAR